MATQTYMYLNNGTKVPVYGNANTHSMPYRAYVTEEKKPKVSTSTKKTGSGTQTVTTVTTPQKSSYDYGAAALAAEMRAQREAEAARAAEEARRRQEKINSINANKEKETKLLGDNLATQKTAAKLSNEDNLKQLYIAYMQGLRGVPQQQALWGAGGEIESLKNRSRLNYETNRAKENRAYSATLNDIQQKYNDDLRQLEQKYLQQLLNV